MCPERGRPPPRNNCIHLHLCMHPVSPARVTMMENNNLLLYKLLCKDKVGDATTRVTVGKGKRESEMKKQIKAHMRGKCILSNVLLCHVMPAKQKSGSCFWSYYIHGSLCVTLYSDCLQVRRHFPVKVSLMNSNDPTECLRQVIHNHSSFIFPLTPPPTPPTAFHCPICSLHLSSCCCKTQLFLELVAA